MFTDKKIIKSVTFALASMSVLAIIACSTETETVEVIKEVQVEREVPVEVIREVTVEVPGKSVETIVTKEVQVEKEVPADPGNLVIRTKRKPYWQYRTAI